ncbi:MAG: hypothetical protein GXP31_17440 [Kiritimatiellaeota bacterium]|nr:hypothetical protein [Kiritimatiellota bacterium]
MGQGHGFTVSAATRRSRGIALLVLFDFAAVYASPVPLACRWLASRQTSSGVWSQPTARMSADTLRAAQALETAGTDVDRVAALRARGALLLALEPHPDLVPNRLAVFLCDSAGTGAALLAAQNADGGWPMAVGQQSNVLDTALVVNALAGRDLLAADCARRAAAWLTTRQQPDGLWTLSADGGPGRLELTARVVRAVDALRFAVLDDVARAALDTAVDAALPALRASFRADGRFALDADLAKPASVTDTASAYCTLVRFDPPGLYSDALLLLERLQAADGHWSEPGAPDQDVCATAAAVLAFGAVRTPDPGPLPDLLVHVSGIWFTPALPHPGQTVTVHAVVFNIGAAFAANVAVAFFRGDPREDGVRIGAVRTVAAIPAAGSVHVQVVLDTAALTASPRVFATADPQNQVPETDETNNLAFRRLPLVGVGPADAAHGPNLHLSTAGLTFGQVHTDTLRLTNPTVDVGVLLENSGDTALARTRLDVRDGAAPIARVMAPTIPAGNAVMVHFPWSPGAGVHVLRVTGDAAGAVAESDESDNIVDLTLQVVGSMCSVAVTRWVDNKEYDPPCQAYDVVRLTVMSAFSDAAIRLRLLGPDGTPPEFAPVSLDFPGVWQWNAGNARPGRYIAQARYLHADTGALLARAEAEFDVAATTALRALRVSLPRRIVDAGVIDPLPITVVLENGSNLDSRWRVSWRLLDPEGTPMGAASAPEDVQVLAAQLSKQVVLSRPVTGTLTLAGRYTVEVTARDLEGAVAARATAWFSLLPPLHLGIRNEVVPAQVAPLGKVRVRTVLQLSAGNAGDSPDVPVEIRHLEVTPRQDIVDDVASSVSILGTQVVNSLGQIVPDGTRIAVRALYGTIPSGTAAPEADPTVGVRILSVVNGTVQLDYAPSGTALPSMEPPDGGGQWDPNQSGANEHSVVVLRFYQYFPDKADWLGTNIANAEVFLKRQ